MKENFKFLNLSLCFLIVFLLEHFHLGSIWFEGWKSERIKNGEMMEK